MPDANPFQPPSSIDESMSIHASIREGIDTFAFSAWPVVFLLNMILPLLFGWDMVQGAGLFGVGAAAALYLVGGWWLCFTRPSLARILIYGSMLLAPTQLFPLIQIIAGLIAMIITESCGLISHGDDATFGQITHVLGGFMMTFLVGGILIAVAGTIGLILSVFLPRRWISRTSEGLSHPPIELG